MAFSTFQKFGVSKIFLNVFVRSPLTKAALFDLKYTEDCNVMKYCYN